MGDSGIGKSTLLANIFNDNSLYQISEQKQPENDTNHKKLDSSEVPPDDFEDSDISEKEEQFELSEDSELNNKSASETLIYEVPENLDPKSVDPKSVDSESIHEPNKSAKIKSSTHVLTSKKNISVEITLNVFEVKHFNESMENKTHHSIAPIIEFLEDRLYQDFNLESKPRRCIKEMESQVNRIHTCLYLIPAIYRPLRAIDLAAFQGLQQGMLVKITWCRVEQKGNT